MPNRKNIFIHKPWNCQYNFSSDCFNTSGKNKNLFIPASGHQAYFYNVFSFLLGSEIPFVKRGFYGLRLARVSAGWVIKKDKYAFGS